MKPKTEQLNKSLMVKSGFTTFSKKKRKRIGQAHKDRKAHTREILCVYLQKLKQSTTTSESYDEYKKWVEYNIWEMLIFKRERLTFDLF